MTEETRNKLNGLWNEAIQAPMSELESSGDHKWATMSAENDSWDRFELEVDTDDCDRKRALASAEFMRALWNSWVDGKI